jgi:hypothetical protein
MGSEAMEVVEGAVSIRVERGCLRVLGEIPVSCGREELEAFVAEICLKLLGDSKKPKLPSFGLTVKELTEAEAAIYIGRSRSFLSNCRIKGKTGAGRRGPKFTRDSQRAIRYSVAELDKWLASRPLYEANCEVMSNA